MTTPYIDMMLDPDRQSRCEHNDCAVTAIALALEIEYDQAHRALQDAGRCHGQTVTLNQMEAALDSFADFMLLTFDEYGHGVDVAQAAHLIDTRSAILVTAEGHAVAWRDGQPLDPTVADWDQLAAIFELEYTP